jgi:predicted transcriptional regulator of viral defense system
VKITNPERTLLDGLMALQYCGDFGEVLHAFETRGAKLDLERIVEHALKLDSATVKRLGWVLERQGIPAARLEPLRAASIKSFRVLHPTGPRRGPCSAGWMIRVNLTCTAENADRVIAAAEALKKAGIKVAVAYASQGSRVARLAAQPVRIRTHLVQVTR